MAIDTRYLHCGTCKHYAENESEMRKRDGFCLLGLRINGKKVNDRQPVDYYAGRSCRDWIDRDTGLTHFEVETMTPEPMRTPQDVEYLTRFINWRATSRK